MLRDSGVPWWTGGQRLLVWLLVCFLIPVAGCRKKVQPQTPAEPVVQVPDLAPLPPFPPAKSKPELVSEPEPEPPAPSPPLPDPAELIFEQAQTLFQEGDYLAAGEAYYEYLLGPVDPTRELEVVYRLALIYATRSQEVEERRRATELFQRLIERFPYTPEALYARSILDLFGQLDRYRRELNLRNQRIRQLNDELEKLKQIDMQRRPEPPPE